MFEHTWLPPPEGMTDFFYPSGFTLSQGAYVDGILYRKEESYVLSFYFNYNINNSLNITQYFL
jgi:hypothetical protein